MLVLYMKACRTGMAARLRRLPSLTRASLTHARRQQLAFAARRPARVWLHSPEVLPLWSCVVATKPACSKIYQVRPCFVACHVAVQ